MFKNDRVTIVEWLIILIIIPIPVVNFIFLFYVLLNRNISKTIENLVYALLIMMLIALGLFAFLR